MNFFARLNSHDVSNRTWIVSADESDMTTVIPRSTWPASRKRQAVEVCVFLGMIVPSIVISLFTVGQWKYEFVTTAISVILRDLALCSLVLYFLWQNGEPFRSIGWSARLWPVQILVGVALFPAVLIGAYVVAFLFLKLGLSNPHSTLRSALSVHEWWQVPLAVLLVAVVAVVEETVFRGYLLLRFRAVTGNLWVAIVLSTIIFTAGHTYEGGAGMAAVAALGLAFMALYLSTRSLIASIVVYFLFDLVGVVVVPMLVKHQ
jgi:membrane protease YdiL (CAAX protease family)